MTLTFTSAPTLPDGLYPATLTAIEDRVSDRGDFRRWVFQVVDGSRAVEQSATSSMFVGPQSKAYKWATALLDRTPKPGEEVDLVGRRCTLQVEIDAASGYSRVADVLPASPSSSPNFRLNDDTLGYHPPPADDGEAAF